MHSVYLQIKSVSLNLLSCPSYDTLEIPVQLQTFLYKNCSICVLPLSFMETLYSFGDYGLVLVIIRLSIFLGIFSVIAQMLVFKAVWVWKINWFHHFTNLSLKYIDYFLFYFFILVWPASALLGNRANSLTRIHPAGKKNQAVHVFNVIVYITKQYSYPKPGSSKDGQV